MAAVLDNGIYLKIEWHLKAVYFLTTYGGPEKNGIPFKENIDVIGSMSVSAKVTLFGIRRSELEPKDIVVSTSDLEIMETDKPGAFIRQIMAYLTGKIYFSGVGLTSKDFQVKRETITREEVIIENFDFTPSILIERENKITVSYKNLFCWMKQTVWEPNGLRVIDNRLIRDLVGI